MSSTSSTYHIPFPRTFLSLNTPITRSNVNLTPAEPEQSAHGFLSNVTHHSARHASISSLSSLSSMSDTVTSSSHASEPTGSPQLGPKIFAPLALNTKHSVLPPSSAREVSEKAYFFSGGFLSNRV